MAQVLERVDVGETFSVRSVNDRGDVVRITPERYRVQPRCSHNAGVWACATHEMRFSNQFCKYTHIHDGSHRLAWFCFECGTMQVP